MKRSEAIMNLYRYNSLLNYLSNTMGGIIILLLVEYKVPERFKRYDMIDTP